VAAFVALRLADFATSLEADMKSVNPSTIEIFYDLGALHHLKVNKGTILIISSINTVIPLGKSAPGHS
jgi:heme/copper-type cytochrome/quinol oxidase subunit 3